MKMRNLSQGVLLISTFGLAMTAATSAYSQQSAIANTEEGEHARSMSLRVAPLAVSPKLYALQQRWAKVNYTLQGEEQKMAFKALIAQAHVLTQEKPNSAANWAWLGICQSTAAAAIGGTGALGLAKEAKISLEKSITIDKQALDGAATTTLGALYHKLPGWPLSFGSDKKAEKLLLSAVVAHPESIDANFFYAEFLYDDGDNKTAREYLLRAQQAPARPNRPMADKYRRIAVDALLNEIASEQ